MIRKNKPDTLSKEAIAQYIISDMEMLTQRALQLENRHENKVNFYLVIVTAVVGGLLIFSSNENVEPIVFPIACMVLLVLHILGWITLHQGIDLSSGAASLFRRISRLRQWFLDQEPSLLPFLPYTPGDDQPHIYVEHMPLRRMETILLFVNAVLLGTFVGVGWIYLYFEVIIFRYTHDWISYLIALILGVVTSAISWIAETSYARNFMKRIEQKHINDGMIHFPSQPYQSNE